MIRLGLAVTTALVCGALATTAQAATVASGTLRALDGTPSAGSVHAYAWPDHDGQMELPLLGEAQVTASGRYAIRAQDDAALRTLAAARGGSLDLLLMSSTPSGIGQDVITARFGGDGDGARMAADRPGATLDLKTRWSDGIMARAAAPGPCLPPVSEKVDEQVQQTVVGELNNAYRDVRASWAYGKKADSSISVMVKPADGPWEVGGSRKVDNTASVMVSKNGQPGPYSRQFRSKFVYGKYKLVPRCPFYKPSESIRAEEWIPDFDESRKQTGTLRVCPSPRRAPKQTVGYPARFAFRRDESKAVTWEGGAKVFGIGVSVSSGFSDSVRVAYKFGTKRGKTWYLCGSNGKSPASAGRIYSGLK